MSLQKININGTKNFSSTIRSNIKEKILRETKEPLHQNCFTPLIYTFKKFKKSCYKPHSVH